MSYIEPDFLKSELEHAIKTHTLNLSYDEQQKLFHLIDKVPHIEETYPQRILQDFQQEYEHRYTLSGEIPVSEVEDFLFNYTGF